MNASAIGTRKVESVDVSPYFTGDMDQRREVAEKVDRACRSLGFLVITGHGVPQRLIDDMRSTAAEFFALPDDVKQKYRSEAGGPGYQPPKATALGRTRGADASPDLKEGYRLLPVDSKPVGPEGAAWFAENIWPAEVRRYQQVGTDYFRAMEQLAQAVLEIMATALGLPEDYFADKVDNSISRLSALRYPATPAGPPTDEMGAGAHTDYGSLTILHKAPGTLGLQIAFPDGSWLDVVPEPGSFVINIGDLLAEWTNDRWVSTVHRVISVPSSDESISIAYFHQPNFDALIEPIPTCVDESNPARYEAITSGAHLRTKLKLQEG